MQIEMIDISKLHAYKNNPRKNDQAVERMVSAIREFGFRIPILAKRDGEIIDGHLRYKAAIASGLAEVPAVYVDNLSEEKIRAMRISINRAADWADWDIEILNEEIRSLSLGDIQMIGFTEKELIDILDGGTKVLTDEDVIDLEQGKSANTSRVSQHGLVINISNFAYGIKKEYSIAELTTEIMLHATEEEKRSMAEKIIEFAAEVFRAWKHL